MDKAEEIKNYFKRGSLYSRGEIHAKFGGNPRSGFSVSQKYPIIFVFTSQEGKEYGYEDGFMSDGFLHIAGEGQIGDMKFTRGNKAIRDHIKNDKLYFQEAKGGKRRYVGEIRFYDYYDKNLKDKSGNFRKGIVFRFKTTDDLIIDKEQETFENKTYREGAEQRLTQTTKERNPTLRKDAITKYGTRCMVCGFSFDEVYGKDIARGYIEVHHEKMLSDSTGECEMSLDEVKVVCSNCHRIIHRRKDMLDWKSLKDKIKK
jgi:5-methylcytosine-specific restriction protein A